MKVEFIPAQLRALAERLPAQWPEHKETCREAADEIERLRKGADRLAYEYAKGLVRGTFRSRTRASDALEDYLEVGGIEGPNDIPTWIAQHEAAEAKGG